MGEIVQFIDEGAFEDEMAGSQKTETQKSRQGGRRPGAGRPVGSGRFREPSRPIRIPISDVDRVMRYVENRCYKIPLYQTAVSAGFPSPAEDDVDAELDLNELLIKHPAATFFLKVSGDSMINAGIHNGDILVVDRSLTPSNGKIVIAAVNAELTVKRLQTKGKKVFLVPENGAYPILEVKEEMDFRIWGVVTNVIHALHK